MLQHKAAKNLEAGETLAALGLVDPATTRYYYALYQAAVHGLTQVGLVPGGIRSGAVEWDHPMVQNNVSYVRGRRSDGALYRAMRKMRQKADYEDDSVEPGYLATHVAAVREFVEEVTR